MASLGFDSTLGANLFQRRKVLNDRANLANTVSNATAGRSMAPTGGLGGGAPIQQPKPDLATTVRAATAGRSMAPTPQPTPAPQPNLATTVRAATAGRTMAPGPSALNDTVRAATAGRTMRPPIARTRRV